MINKYSPLIKAPQRNTCADCYINLVKDNTFINETYDTSFKIPIIQNPSLVIDTVTDMPYNWVEGNYYPYDATIIATPDPCFWSEGNLVMLLNGKTMYISAYEPHAPSLPPYSRYIELEQDFIDLGNNDNHYFYINFDGYFQNVTGNAYINIKDSLGNIMYEGGLGDDYVCFNSTDTNFTLYVMIELDEFTELFSINPCNIIPASQRKGFVFNNINLYTFSRVYEVKALEDFSASNENSIKYNVINSGTSLCIGDANTFMQLTYDVDLKYTTDYIFYIIYNNTYGASNIVLDIFDANNILYSSTSYPITTGSNLVLSDIFSILINGTYKLRFTIGMGDERICVTGLLVGDNYDYSDLTVEGCETPIDWDKRIYCEGSLYKISANAEENGTFIINGAKYPFRSLGAKEPYIKLYYYNSCPISTEDGEFIFFKDENGNPLHYSIVLQGVVFGNTPKALDGYVNEYRFNNKRVFAESIFERDIEVDNLPEELVASLQLALMCDNLLVDLGDGKKLKVNSDKNASIEAETNDIGNLDIKFTLITYGLLNSACSC